MSGEKPVLEMRDVWKRYPNGVVALKGVSLEVEPGDCLGLVGPNGSGKTTLIKVALGLVRRDRGAVMLNGADPLRDPSAREGVGVVFERPNLPSGMPVKTLLAHAADIHGVPRDAVERAIMVAGLNGHEDKQFNELSAGLKQRAAIAHAMVSMPRIIIADEPTSNLDPVERIRVLNTLSQLNSEGVTIVVSSHVLHEVLRIANKIVVLKEGRVVSKGRVEEILKEWSKARIRSSSPETLREFLRRRGFEARLEGLDVIVDLDAAGRGELLRAVSEAEAEGITVIAIDFFEPGVEEVLSG